MDYRYWCTEIRSKKSHAPCVESAAVRRRSSRTLQEDRCVPASAELQVLVTSG